MKRIIVAVLAIGAVILGVVELTKDTPERVALRFQEPYAQRREQMNQLAQSLPARGSGEKKEWSKADPKPVYTRDGKGNNASLIMEEQLTDPGKDLSKGIDLRSYEDLFVPLLRIAGGLDRKSWPIQVHTQPADLSRQLQEALDRPYLIVVRTLSHDPPVVKGVSFTGGRAELVGFLVDLRSNQVLGSARVSANPPGLVKGSEDEIHNVMVLDAKEKLFAALAAATGGMFKP